MLSSLSVANPANPANPASPRGPSHAVCRAAAARARARSGRAAPPRRPNGSDAARAPDRAKARGCLPALGRVLLAGGALAVGSLSALGCAESVPIEPQPEGAGGAAPPADTGGAGAEVPGFLPNDAASSRVDASRCASTGAAATRVRRAVDIVLVVDNSDSMAEETAALERELSTSLADALAASELSYRVILISAHRGQRRSATTSELCISAPLSSVEDCRPFDPPGLTSRFFQYSTHVSSHNALEVVLDTYARPFESTLREDEFGNAPRGWSSWLRLGADKVLAVFSDGDSSLAPEVFIQRLVRMGAEHFGSEAEPNFVFHSIVGLASDEPVLDPQAPLVTTRCSREMASAGESFQRLSRATGGTRASLCAVDTSSEVFVRLTEGVRSSSNLPCDAAVPSAPGSRSLDLTGVQVLLSSPQWGEARALVEAANAGSCRSGSFYLAGDRIWLCPEACREARDVEGAEWAVTIPCTVEVPF